MVENKLTAEEVWKRFHGLVDKLRPLAKEFADLAHDLERGHLADSFTDYGLAWGWGDVNILYNCIDDDFGHDTDEYDPFSEEKYEE